MQLLIEHEARVTACVFYLDREVATARELDGPFEMLDVRRRVCRRAPAAAGNSECRGSRAARRSRSSRRAPTPAEAPLRPTAAPRRPSSPRSSRRGGSTSSRHMNRADRDPSCRPPRARSRTARNRRRHPPAGRLMREANRPLAVAASFAGQRDGAVGRRETRPIEREQLRARREERDVVGALRDEAVDQQQVSRDAALDERRVVLIQDRRGERVRCFPADQARTARRCKRGDASARELTDDRPRARAGCPERVRPSL